MNSTTCINCGHIKNSDKENCEVKSWGKYHYFGKTHRYKPLNREERKQAKRDIGVVLEAARSLTN